MPKGFLAAGLGAVLDLGKLSELASVTVNGQPLGVCWHAPFRVAGPALSAALRPGRNTIEIAVTNTWHNRLIGDEQEPEDVVWGKERNIWNKDAGRPLTAYPDWFIAGKPRPSAGRQCFVTWNYFTKTSPLLPAGLFGPVSLSVQAEVPIAP